MANLVKLRIVKLRNQAGWGEPSEEFQVKEILFTPRISLTAGGPRSTSGQVLMIWFVPFQATHDIPGILSIVARECSKEICEALDVNPQLKSYIFRVFYLVEVRPRAGGGRSENDGYQGYAV